MKFLGQRWLHLDFMRVFLWTTLMLMSVTSTKGFAELEPAMEIEVQQEDGQIAFRFFIRDTVFFFIRTRTQIGVSNLMMIDATGKTIWAIQLKKSEDPSAVAKTVTYGVVPEGFYQQIPTGESAPVLKKNMRYDVWASWGGGSGGRTTFVYDGN